MKLKAEDKFAGLHQRAQALQAKFGPDPYLVSSRVAEALCPPPAPDFGFMSSRTRSAAAKQLAEYTDKMMYDLLKKGVGSALIRTPMTVATVKAGETLTLDKVKQAAIKLEAKLDAERAAFIAEMQALNTRQSVPDRVADALCPPKANKDDMLDAIKYSFLQPWQVHQVDNRGAIALNSCA